MIGCFSRQGAGALFVASVLLSGCDRPDEPPPPTVMFEGLPITGRWNDAREAGFTSCVDVTRRQLRCRRGGVMFRGFGPFDAAIDLNGSEGRSGFNHLTIWNDVDQNALIGVVKSLERQGWQACFTGEGSRGDQGIYKHPNGPVIISLDLSYSGKRRLRFLPRSNKLDTQC